MALNEYLPVPVYDYKAHQVRADISGLRVNVVYAGTNTLVTGLVEMQSGAPLTNPVLIGSDGYTPWMGLEDGPDRLDIVSGDFRTPLRSAEGLAEYAATSAADATLARVAAESAAADAAAVIADVVNPELVEADTVVASFVATPGSATGAKLREQFVPATGSAVIASDWTFDKGRVPNTAVAPRVAVHRTFSKAAGDLFNADVTLVTRVAQQQSTTQNPPGYNMGEVVLVENGDQTTGQGDQTSMRLISNRVLFNRRVEVDQGGGGRATLRSGSDPTEQFARIQLHDAEYPRATLYGPQDATLPNTYRVEQAAVLIERGGTAPVRVTTRDSANRLQELQVSQFAAGHQSIRAFNNNVVVGSIRFEHSDGSIRLESTNAIHLSAKTIASADIEVTTAGQGVVLKSPNGSRFRLVVGNDGALSTVPLA